MHIPRPSNQPPSSEVLHVLAEDLVALTGDPPRAPRLSPDERAADHPVEAVLDRLEQSVSFDESHDWMLRGHVELDGLRPIDFMAQQRYTEVFALIDQDFPLLGNSSVLS